MYLMVIGKMPRGFSCLCSNSLVYLSLFFSFFFFNKFIYLLIFYFWLHLVFIAVHRLSLGSSLRCAGFSLQWLLLLQSTGSRRAGQLWLAGSRRVAFSSCATWAQLLHGMWDLPGPGLGPQTRARNHVPCIGRRILNRCAYLSLFILAPMRFFQRCKHFQLTRRKRE